MVFFTDSIRDFITVPPTITPKHGIISLPFNSSSRYRRVFNTAFLCLFSIFLPFNVERWGSSLIQQAKSGTILSIKVLNLAGVTW
jgi:hypothetical protein